MFSLTRFVFLLLGLVVILGLWRARQGQQAAYRASEKQVTAQKVTILKLEAELNRERLWGGRLFGFEVERHARLRSDVEAAQKEVDQAEQVVQTPQAVEQAGVAPNASMPTLNVAREQMTALQAETATQIARVREEYDSQKVETEAEALKRDTQLARDVEENQRALELLEAEAKSQTGVLSYGSREQEERATKLKSELHDRRIQLGELKAERERVRNQKQVDVLKLEAEKARQIRNQQQVKSELQKLIQSAEGSTIPETEQAGIVATTSTVGTDRGASLSEHQRLLQKLETQKNILVREEAAFRKFMQAR